jgi:RES domain-containing protein
MPLPPYLGGPDVLAWRLERTVYAETWDSGEGAYRCGGRWSSVGLRVVYCAMDPATAILEVAVHRGFDVLDTERHTLTWLKIADPSQIHVVNPSDVPNPNWLRPGYVSQGQRQFGRALLHRHGIVAFPSVVSTHSWNLAFIPSAAAGAYALVDQEPFALDGRLHPPV